MEKKSEYRRFSEEEYETLSQVLQHRRDVRGNRFSKEKIPEEQVQKILQAAIWAPSVGFSQPWEFVLVTDSVVRREIHDSFEEENEKAAALFHEERNDLYQQLKLEGILESPLNVAVFYRPSEKPVLGQTTMEEMGKYSVVCAIQNMWLAARALNIGMGWVSILDPKKVKSILDVPQDRELIGYMCLGYVDYFLPEPELLRLNWEKRKQLESLIHREKYGC
ncbi:5,6-dimethylbenzimidazole synthase [Xanthovirga aplysinae]|uniref:5,6-dimethylbenzimidazole synthase n=1 Tax=Xanthovirga aplysinae TaxID=2529853 RepID=UPI0012BC3E5E|nr:5,6-dimethylbenzimidazole synthase [Xanthovirga aplysinae]MTI33554.1 5,6-dimethylbenzimidazole synthase [Xanthovirga aplysinae]